eukprot:sb/3479310/
MVDSIAAYSRFAKNICEDRSQSRATSISLRHPCGQYIWVSVWLHGSLSEIEVAQRPRSISHTANIGCNGSNLSVTFSRSELQLYLEQQSEHKRL